MHKREGTGGAARAAPEPFPRSASRGLLLAVAGCRFPPQLRRFLCASCAGCLGAVLELTQPQRWFWAPAARLVGKEKRNVVSPT